MSGWIKRQAILLAMQERRIRHVIGVDESVLEQDSCACEAIWKSGDDRLAIHRMEEDGTCSGYFSGGNNAGSKTAIPWSRIRLAELNFRQSNAYIVVHYTSAWSFLICWWAGWWRFLYLKDVSKQWIFNTRTPRRTAKVNVISALVKVRLRDAHAGANGQTSGINGFYSVGCIAELVHGERFWRLPTADSMLAEIEMILEDLCQERDIEVDDNRYRALGRAISTVASYEEANRRHRVSVAQNWIMVFLTLSIAISSYLALQ